MLLVFFFSFFLFHSFNRWIGRCNCIQFFFLYIFDSFQTVRHFDIYIKKKIQHTEFVANIKFAHTNINLISCECLTISLSLYKFFFSLLIIFVCLVGSNFARFTYTINREWEKQRVSHALNVYTTHMQYAQIHSRSEPQLRRLHTIETVVDCFYRVYICFCYFFSSSSFFNLCNRNSYSNPTMVWRMFYYIIDVMVSVQVSPVTRI